MSEQQRINPLIMLIEDAESEEYRHEAALSVATYYEQRLGNAHPGVLEIKKVAIMSLFNRVPDAMQRAQKAWTKERNALGFWKKLRTPHEVPESFVEQWMDDQRMRALMDVSHIITERSEEL